MSTPHTKLNVLINLYFCVSDAFSQTGSYLSTSVQDFLKLILGL